MCTNHHTATLVRQRKVTGSNLSRSEDSPQCQALPRQGRVLASTRGQGPGFKSQLPQSTLRHFRCYFVTQPLRASVSSSIKRHLWNGR